MRKEDFCEVIGNIKDDYIREANVYKKRFTKAAKTRFAALAACACLLICAGFQYYDYMHPEDLGNTSVEESSVPDLGSDKDISIGSEVLVKETQTADETKETQEIPTPVVQINAEPVDLYSAERAVFLNTAMKEDAEEVTPSVEDYYVAADMSNITNLEHFQKHYGYLNLDPDSDLARKLVQNGFVVTDYAGSEFFEIYEWNRYDQIPNFVTVDSLMHTYHLYFSHLLKNIERDYLVGGLSDLSVQMLENSKAQYEQLKGSEWEDAALRNIAFFTIGAKLLDESIVIDEAVKDAVESELDKINRAEGIEPNAITGGPEDYTQYIPRGYYEGDERLEAYFRAMMWYGRVHFAQSVESLDRSALLITQALAEDEEAAGLWEAIYTVTSFFAGASDDLIVYEYAPLIRQIYGIGIEAKDLIGLGEKFAEFHEETAKLRAPKINSVSSSLGESSQLLGFRFMGQRFTIDATIMQNLIYDKVGGNNNGEARMLPDVLDVPAALGSDAAFDILEEQGDTEYKGYTETISQLRFELSMENTSLWDASLYASWLNTLRPLLTEKGEGYPMFMQNEEWTKKNLECFAGSFTELKHDTILYSKQSLAEMGGGYEIEEADDKGYVEPEPLVYERFAYLAEMTAAGLKKYDMLSETEEENLNRLTQIAELLLNISNKELRDEVLTDEEYDFIRGYGGNLEHFWFEMVRDEEGDHMGTIACPAAIVADIATNPSGTVLEAATGNPSRIIVAVKVDDKIKLAQGSVYSFYQFEWPMDDRLTDTKWRLMMGFQADENYNRVTEKPIKQPEWTASYRYELD